MEKKEGVFVVKRLQFSDFLDLDFTFAKPFGLSFKKSRLDVDSKI